MQQASETVALLIKALYALAKTMGWKWQMHTKKGIQNVSVLHRVPQVW